MRRLMLLVLAAGCGSGNKDKPDAAIDAPPAGTGTLTLSRAYRWVPRDTGTTVAFTVDRGADLTGDVTVHVDGLPADVTAPDVTVPAGATTGQVLFSAASTAALGTKTTTHVQLVSAGEVLDDKTFEVRVSGAPGTIDTTFGTAGHVTLSLPDPVVPASNGTAFPRAVVQYTSGPHAGKIVVAAELRTLGSASDTKKLAVVRFNADGTPDSTFGSAGVAIIDASPANYLLPVDVDLDSQGRVVVTARRDDTSNICTIYVVRLTAGGAPDSGFTTFAEGNSVGGCGDAIGSVVLGGDKILSVGNWNLTDGSQRPLLMMINADGTKDNTAFGSSFQSQLPNPSSTKPTLRALSIAVDASGRWLLAGNKCDGGWNATYASCESVVGRVTTAGAWDTSFGAGDGTGKGFSSATFGTTAASPQPQFFNRFALDSTGGIVATGWSEDYTSGTIARFSATDGAVDTAFGTSGSVTPILNGAATTRELSDLGFDDEGRIVFAGYVATSTSFILTTRYSAGGVVDSTYGAAGVSNATAASALDPRLVVQADGRAVVIGSSPRTGSGHDVSMWRYWP